MITRRARSASSRLVVINTSLAIVRFGGVHCFSVITLMKYSGVIAGMMPLEKSVVKIVSDG